MMSTVSLGIPKFVPRAEIGTDGGNFLPRRHDFGSSEGRLGVPKPSLIVRTESNVFKEEKRRPIPSCVICNGSGRVDCHECHGKGRTNSVHLTMLPKGEWPKWCKMCGGSGLGYCNRCLGTGEYRDIMGFQFMRQSSNPLKDKQ
ncbi:dnaJ/Hsp40 cysteine-rich domain superfamily protein [Wolffia australiana]